MANTKPLVYVAGAYSAPTIEGLCNNLAIATLHTHHVLLAGAIPVTPHKITAFFDGWPATSGWSHQDWLDRFCFPLLLRCDIVYLCPNWRDSKGATLESEFAMLNSIPVVEDVAQLKTIMEVMGWS